MNKAQEAWDKTVLTICESTHADEMWVRESEAGTRIQQLIDNALTVEEINVLMVCMSYYAMRHPGKTTINGIDVDFMSELFNKLDKQKEMWEEVNNV